MASLSGEGKKALWKDSLCFDRGRDEISLLIQVDMNLGEFQELSFD